MASYSNVDSLDLGTLLQIVFSNGVRNQLSENYKDFTYVEGFRVSDSMAREIRFMFQDSYGPAAVQYGNPGTRGNFPRAQQASVNEYTAKLKKVNATVDVDYDVYDRARKTPEKYMLPLALEIQSKTTAAKRRIAADFHADGTGVIAEIASVGAFSSGAATFTLAATADNFGHVGMVEIGDLYIITDEDGTARGPATTSNFYAWKCTDKDRENNQITLQAVDSDLANDTDAADNSFGADQVLYRIGDPSLVGVGTSDNSSVTSSINLASVSDWGTGGFAITGLDSLLRSSRTVHGISLTGANAPTEKTLTASEQIDSRYIQQLLSKVKNVVGEDAYSWKQLIMPYEALDALIDSRESDRRFQTYQDGTRGTPKWGYVHQNDMLEATTSEYCKPSTAYVLPEAKDGKKVFEFWSTDFEPVKGEDMTAFHLDVNSSGYTNGMVNFLQGYGQIICNHAAACGVLRGFTNA